MLLTDNVCSLLLVLEIEFGDASRCAEMIKEELDDVLDEESSRFLFDEVGRSSLEKQKFKYLIVLNKKNKSKKEVKTKKSIFFANNN
jgi:hypothetical protein